VIQVPISQATGEELIASIDVTQLHAIRWWFLQLFAPRYVEDMELGCYVRELLATREWSMVRVTPHADTLGTPSMRVYDVYGTRVPDWA
jgi:hypothetical protein